MKYCSKKYLRKTIFETFKQTSKIPHHRYKSWVHCYKFFRKKRPGNAQENKKWLDLASLNLAMYLASWGMYRGSTIALQFDYKFYVDIIRILINSEYSILWNLKLEKWENENKEKLIEKYSNKISTLINALKDESNRTLKDVALRIKEIKQLKTYRNNKFLSKSINSLLKIEDKKSTDTLISKILLGTMGCLPAYDNYFIQGLKKCKTDIARRINGSKKKAFSNLVNFYFDNNNRTELDEIKKTMDKYEKKTYKNDKIEYPIMKLIDMHFWTIGFQK